ncbi:GIY-YIG nuclease family protein, partial [Candidatus Shapirobacteria bacterium]|nr:GIY-YIG nuclease family protein [Candidatus Shapirobacteria bacterium]
MTEIIYILTNEAMLGYVKIGRTSDLMRRLKDLYITSVPLPFECHYACAVENGKETEGWLFEIFNKWRVSKDREFFRIE